MSEVLRMSFKEGGAPDGRDMAVITSGGHPVVDPGRPCTVLGVQIVDDIEAAKVWFERMLVERPWEARQ